MQASMRAGKMCIRDRYTAEEAKKAANELGYPVLVRPSYVLGGQGMQIAINDQEDVYKRQPLEQSLWISFSTTRLERP